MTVRLIKDGVYTVDAADWNERHFHGHTYVTKRGVAYNSYLIVDEKITLIDTIRRGYEKKLIENIRIVADLSKIDVIIINHIEPDHYRAFPEILKLRPSANFACDKILFSNDGFGQHCATNFLQ